MLKLLLLEVIKGGQECWWGGLGQWGLGGEWRDAILFGFVLASSAVGNLSMPLHNRSQNPQSPGCLKLKSHQDFQKSISPHSQDLSLWNLHGVGAPPLPAQRPHQALVLLAGHLFSPFVSCVAFSSQNQDGCSLTTEVMTLTSHFSPLFPLGMNKGKVMT